jgi:hypothetical protein
MFNCLTKVLKIKQTFARFIKKVTETFSLHHKSGNFSLSFY